MIEAIQAYVVNAESRGLFELTYGPGGAWSNLFAKSEGFRGVSVLRDTHDPQRYLTFELWDSESQREKAIDEQEDEFRRLESDLAEWIESSTRASRN